MAKLFDANGNEIAVADAVEPGDVDSLEVTMSDGSVRTVAELKNGSMMHADYTQKTTEVARREQELNNREQTISEREEKASKAWEALQRDIQWYNQNPQEKWADYQPGVKETLEGENAVTTEPVKDPRLDKVVGYIEQREQKDAEEEALAQVRTMRTQYQNAIKEFPLADEDLVIDRIDGFQARNGKLPTETEIKAMVKGLHEKLVAKGAKVEVGVVTESGKPKDGVAPGATNDLRPVADSIDHRNIEQVEEGVEAFMTARAEAREGV